MVKHKGIVIAVILTCFVIIVAGVWGIVSFVMTGIAPFTKSVAVIEVKGVIADSEEIIKQIKEYKENSNVAAVVLRVNSPGGSAAASQEIYEELKKLAKEKILVVSMGDVAASGGYYISVAADFIYANPATTTGSIGVIAEMLNIEEALNHLGIKGIVIKSGKFKDTFSPLRPMTEEERVFLQEYIDDIFHQFVKDVADGRKLPESEIIKIADGRIITGQQALKLKLIDGLGNMEDAIDKAAELAGIEGKPNVIYPEKKRPSLLSILLSEVRGGLSERISDRNFRAEYRMIP
ncbi:MAG: signal peptide peptidase SppA [Deltaproteobacteria bacterium]|nr:signal peptide peptidase SppA [Candidatus Zymogenaceae bacterium]